jgi:hypothetical protein
MIEQLARVGFVQEFTLFIPLLTQILATKGELTGSTVVVLVILSCYLSIHCGAIQMDGAGAILPGTRPDPCLGTESGGFLKNVGEIPQ